MRLVRVLALALLVTIPAAQPAGQEPERGVAAVRAPRDAPLGDVEVLARSPTFALVRAPPSVLADLAARHPSERIPTLVLKGRVDVSLPPADESPYALVVLEGPLPPEAMDWIRARTDLLEPIPPRSFAARIPTDLRAEVASAPFIAHVGAYPRALKLHPLLADEDEGLVDVQLWRGETLSAAQAAVERAGGEVVGSSSAGGEGILRVRIGPGGAAALAALPMTSWIEPVLMTQPLDNDRARWVVQSGLPSLAQGVGGASLHARGLTGHGQIVAIADGGVPRVAASFTHPAFDDPTAPFQVGVINPAHRKVLGYLPFVEGGIVKGDAEGTAHGAHTAGSLAGDAPDEDRHGTAEGFDGLAVGARLLVQDLSIGNVFHIPLDYAALYGEAYAWGARVHSDSYGSSNEATYGLRARQQDAFAWAHPDFLAFRSMGNAGARGMRPEAVAKDVVSVGASGNGLEQNDMYGLSSRGPAGDGRVKPSLVAPGVNIVSAGPGNGYDALSGTSMATAIAAGAGALARQYFEEGWHPGGFSGSGPSVTPSSALLRAVLVHASRPIGGSGTGSPGLTTGALDGAGCPGSPCAHASPPWPNADAGWGLLRLGDILAPPAPGRDIRFLEGAPLRTGETWTYRFEVGEASRGLWATLAWTDPPASAGASPALVNDLDLVLRTPEGVILRGNVFGGASFATASLNGPGALAPPQSVPGGSPDRRNVEERIVLDAATPGLYEFHVVGANVLVAQQPFALVIGTTPAVDATRMTSD